MVRGTNGDGTGKKIARRRYLRALGASSAALALAGCTDDAGEGATTTGTTTTGTDGDGETATTGETSTESTQTQQNCQPMDPAFTQDLSDTDPTKYHFNPFNSKLNFGNTIHHDQLGLYARASQEYEGVLAEDWQLDSETLTFTLRDDYTWMQRSGDLRSGSWEALEPVTAEDVALQFWMYRFQENPLADIVEDWEVKDDRTIELRRKDANYSDVIFEQRVIPNRVFTPRALWADTIEELKGLEKGSDEFSKTLGEKVLNRKIGPDEIVAHGAWLFDSVKAKRKVVAKKNPEHPRAGNINFDIREWVKVGKGKQGMVTAMTQNTVDYAGDQRLTESVQQNIPDPWHRTEVPALGGGAMYFNMDHEWFGNPKVRQATRFAIDNSKVCGNTNSKPVDSRISGISNKTVQDNWISEIHDDLTDYGGVQQERAANLMREAGAEKNSDGWWADSSGNPIEAPIKTLGGWTAAVTMAQTIASQLKDFGIKAKAVAIENSEFWEHHWNPSEPDKVKDFTLIRYPVFGAFGIYHPYYYEFYYFAGEVARNQIKTAREYEVPSEIGNPDSSTKTVDATKLTQEMATTDDRERQKEITHELAWLFNQNVVAYLQDTGTNHTWYDTSAWQMPEVSDPTNPPAEYVDYGLNDLFAKGIVQAKCQNR